VVFDIESGQVIGQCPKDWLPVFLLDSKALLTITDPIVLSEVNRYEVEERKLKPIPKSFEGETNQTRFLGASSDQLFTGLNTENGHWTVPSWMPEFIRPTLKSLFDKWKRPLTVKSWNINTGKQFKECQVAYLGGLMTKVSFDGSLMTIEDNDDLSLWDLPPRRSTTCWLISSTLALLALWLAYPRRIHPQKLHPQLISLAPQ